MSSHTEFDTYELEMQNIICCTCSKIIGQIPTGNWVCSCSPKAFNLFFRDFCSCFTKQGYYE